MHLGTLRTVLIAGMMLVAASAVRAGDGDYAWEKWAFPGKLDCSIRYDGDGDGRLETYRPVSTDGCLAFEAGLPNDHVLAERCDWTVVFKSEDGSVIKLVDASWQDHTNDGWKENFYIHPRRFCLKYIYEGSGTWYGYDAARGVYFWGTWTTLPQGKPYFVDYIFNGDVPSIQALWNVEGCSDRTRKFEATEGTFLGTRIEFGQD